jgi:CheY-like chemotaxis protein
VGHRETGPVVLIVDDEPQICDLFASALATIALFPVVAHSAEAALSLLERGLRPSAILLDLKMPGIGGLAFLVRLRADPKNGDVPVAIVTGDCLIPKTLERAVQTLSAEIHFKPMEIEAILALTVRLIDPEPDAMSPA